MSVQLMLEVIERDPDIYLDEIAKELFNLRQVDVSLPTIYRAMKEVGLSHKKVCVIHSYSVRD
jgi:transposase